MASSFITKDDEYGFWINDALMQIVCWGLVFIIDRDQSYKQPWLDEFRENLYNNSQGIFVGWMHLRLGDFLVDDQRKSIFLDIIEKVKAFYLEWGSEIPVGELNAFQLVESTKKTWDIPFETVRAIKILAYLEDVVNNKITIKANSEIDYVF